MAHHVRWEITGAALAIGLTAAGCAGATPAPEAPSPEALEASIDADLGSLRALEVLEVGQLVMRLPAEATACYGLPCNEDDRVLWTNERRTQATRLADLVDRALPAAERAGTTAPAPSELDSALEALGALHIVEVGEMVRVVPANNAECYSLPCPSDVAAAESTNAHNAAVIVAIAASLR